MSKTNLSLVGPGGAEEAAPGPKAPKHFTAKQKDAWRDLSEAAPVEAEKTENRFALEIAATLMAKFRAGKTMNATETKELKKQLVALGLAKADDDGSPKKPRKNAKYFEDGE